VTSNQDFLKARDFLLRNRDDYATAYRDFRWPKLDRFNWALDYFDVHARGNNTPALCIVDETGSELKLSYAELATRSNQVAHFLRAAGVKRGDRILTMLPNHVALWEVMLAAIKLGAVTIPATTLLTRDDLADRLQRGNVRHVVVTAAETEKFAAIQGDFTRIGVGGEVAGWKRFEGAYRENAVFTSQDVTHATDPMLLYFTSGTTSRPKLVLHSQQSYPVGHLATMYWIGLQPGDVHWNISSPGWAKHAWSCFFAPFNAGATVFVYNYVRFNARAALEIVCRHAVTVLCAPPTVWRMLIQEDLTQYPVKLRSLVGAGEPLNPEVIEQVRRAWNITIRDGFGQTESSALIANTPGQPVKPGSMGRPLPGFTVALLDSNDRPAQEGEVCVALDPRPTGLMVGYADNAETTAQVMRAGYYRTGDTATCDADGYYTYVGRTDDVFKASDYRISPFELESVLIEHEAIAEAAVVPSPDPVRLAVPKAFVALRDGYQPSRELARDVLAHTRKRLSAYKCVRRLQFADLPKTISGKIRRAELRKRELGRTDLRSRAELEYWEEDLL